jgi:hypothetical protein
LGCFVILGWLWGINVFVWKKYGIAYTKIFGLDPSTTLSERVRPFPLLLVSLSRPFSDAISVFFAIPVDIPAIR